MRKISEYLFNYESDYLYWHLVLEYQKKYMFEAYSFVKEICNLAPKIIDIINKNLDKKKLEIDDLNASFFKKLILTIDTESDLPMVGADADLRKSDKNTAYVTLFINPNEMDEEELRSTIEHELVHIYQNTHALEHGKSIQQSIDKRGYDTYTDFTGNICEIRLKELLYYFDPDEISARIQGIISKVKPGELSNPKKVWDIVKDNETYKHMKFIYDIRNQLNIWIPGLAEWYRGMFPKWKSLTAEQIEKKIIDYVTKNWRIFINKLSKACVGKSERTIK